MGLSLYYEFKIKTDADGARGILTKLREQVATLPFDPVSEILEWDSPDGRYAFERADDDEQGRAIKPGTIYLSRKTERDDDDLVPVPANHAICFYRTLEGCETAKFGLATHPPAMVHHETVVTPDPDGNGSTRQLAAGDRVEIETDLRGQYSWWCAVKTQYAGGPQHGGPANFLRAHLSIYRAVDMAESLGMEVTISDDAGYEKDRDESKLLKELAKHDELIAGFAGKLKDQLGENVSVVAPITDRPDFEHLEARGAARPELGR